jgi:hypothetical protein
LQVYNAPKPWFETPYQESILLGSRLEPFKRVSSRAWQWTWNLPFARGAGWDCKKEC